MSSRGWSDVVSQGIRRGVVSGQTWCHAESDVEPWVVRHGVMRGQTWSREWSDVVSGGVRDGVMRDQTCRLRGGMWRHDVPDVFS